LPEIRRLNASAPSRPRALLAAGLVLALCTGPALAGPPPPPPPPPAHHSPRPPAHEAPRPPAYADDWPHEPSEPPPLPVAMRVIYAPFYVAGLVLHYGVYYVLVAPFEVLGRTLAYGAEGGVERDDESR